MTAPQGVAAVLGGLEFAPPSFPWTAWEAALAWSSSAIRDGWPPSSQKGVVANPALQLYPPPQARVDVVSWFVGAGPAVIHGVV